MSLLRGKKQVPENVEDKIIEISAQMQGSLRFEDPVSLKINGQFQGSLETKGTLSVGKEPMFRPISMAIISSSPDASTAM